MPEQESLSPNTTEQEDITKAGQRRINLIWEFTQAALAILVATAVFYCAANKIDAPTLKDAFVMIVTMYFVRTNHSLIGGIGNKPFNQQR